MQPSSTEGFEGFLHGCSVSVGCCVPVGLSVVPATFNLLLLAAMLMPLDMVPHYCGQNNPNKESYPTGFLKSL